MRVDNAGMLRNSAKPVNHGGGVGLRMRYSPQLYTTALRYLDDPTMTVSE